MLQVPVHKHIASTTAL